MAKALDLAIQAGEAGEIPVGAIVVAAGSKIIGKGNNQTEQLNDVTAHAEILAITAASQYLGAKYLKECTLYVTLEPCVMCAGASAWTQVSRVVYGTAEEKFGFTRLEKNILHPKTLITKFVLQNECAHLMKKFFQQKRN